MAKKKVTPKKDLPKVHSELDGFDISINSFGEINHSINIDQINEFLNKHMDDKKLRGRNEEEEV